MPAFSPFSFPDVLKSSAPAKEKPIPVHVVRTDDFKAWNKKQSASLRTLLAAQNWEATANSVALINDAHGDLSAVYVGTGKLLSLYTLSVAVDALQKAVPVSRLKKLVFSLETGDLSAEEVTRACTGWALACYQFDAYKENRKASPALVLPKGADKARIKASVESISLIRNLINLPANALGPIELADAAMKLAGAKKATAKLTEDKKLLTYNFPLIYGVGDGSEKRPRLVDISWGNPKHPKVTIVGKGVCFDTGGYDLKPSSAMLTMKKDMGGAAMALGLLNMVADLNLPVRLRVLIPAVENSVSGKSYRPSDILNSRKGLTVEIGNTDAEGRLVMADCLTLACEEKPDLLIDFSTLTGAARAATGFEVAAMFSNNDALARELQDISLREEDPVWQLPLWAPYRSDILSPNADLNNSGNNTAGAITAALFLESFVEPGIDWIHLDLSAWELSGKPGRTRGGTDMGMRAVLALLEKRYASKPKKK
jgi:leucyl aminopeptidase